MNCPFCGKAMSEGYLPASSLEWVPKGNVPRLTYPKDRSLGFRVGKHSFSNLKKQPAWYCAFCNRIVIDCNAENPERF